MPVDEWTMLWRILIAAGLGLVVGLDRELHGRAAGLRTCLLVAMSGALLMSLSLHLSQIFAGPAEGSVVRLDPGRLPSYAIAGMGFLGAGAIIQGRLRSRGVTTGAAMWACTGIGLGVGAGLYIPALGATAITLVALKFFREIASHLSREQNVLLRLELDNPAAEGPVRELLQARKAKILFAGRDRCLEADTVVVRLSLSIRSGKGWREMLVEMESIPGVSCYTWEQAEVP
ncbi:MAG: MgtC/SapB family protein [Desulfarculaceae bacterium]|nr:MgtC/SapB family protein [Desulfarculaceae bacterium]MCF8073846.1 MgtC/SapB family protein [Desulfarculaceae bacterium]MCF8102826.1 MgtC/SapB family protein [Desulfarculaceae bacterium]MCF8116270.1 MgtC/SapB family protein [Desulfarculaceae bacterium]